LKRGIDARGGQGYCVSKNAEWLEQEIILSIKVIAKTYETDYEMSRTSGARGRRKRRKPTRWMVGVCVCVCVVSLAALRVRFPV
jgi:hypothetical protein